MTSEAIIAEVVFVLSSEHLYRYPHSRIGPMVSSVVSLAGVEIDHKESVLAALDLYATANLDFEDRLAIAHARRATGGHIVSYDRKIGRVEGVTRTEPGSAS